jgi:hypothetical protein
MFKTLKTLIIRISREILMMRSPSSRIERQNSKPIKTFREKGVFSSLFGEGKGEDSAAGFWKGGLYAE